MLKNLPHPPTMRHLIIILLLFSTIATSAQSLVSNVQISLPAQPQANVANWANAAPPFIITAQTKLENGRVNGTVAESKILVSIKAGGSTICGSYTNANAPQSNFNTAVKTWVGANAVGLLGGDCILKPGSYAVCVSFWANGKMISEETCKEFNIASAETNCTPPQNINPTNNKVLLERDLLKPIVFNWTPSIGTPSANIVYRLIVWEVEEGQAPAQAVYDNLPLLQKVIRGQTSFVANPTTWEKRTATYVWRVEALNREGQPLCKQNTSEPTLFTVQGKEADTETPTSLCVDFEDTSTIHNWYSYFVGDKEIVKAPTDPVNNTNTLRLEDASGGSISINEKDFKGNWLQMAAGKCLCFDYKVDWENFGSNAGSFPKVHIFTGPTLGSLADFHNSTYASFSGNPANPLIQDNVWGKFCLPIDKCNNGVLPSNPYGQWVIRKNGTLLTGAAACTQWDNLIQNISGIVLPTDYNSSPSELVYFDNFCFTNCPGTPSTDTLCCKPDSCLSMDTSAYNIVCNGIDSAGKYSYTISNVILKNKTSTTAKTGLSSNAAGTNYITVGSPYTISNLTPLSAIAIPPSGQVPISFTVVGPMASSIAFTVNAAIKNGNRYCDISLPVSLSNISNCGCNACVDTAQSNIIIQGSTITQGPGNVLQVMQQFNISPTNITKVVAEMVYVDEQPTDTACMQCAANPLAIWKFIPMNKAAWNSTPGYNGSPVNSGGLYPAKKLQWVFSKQGSLVLNLKIALPAISPTLACKRSGKIAIRYSFTDANCITCERLVYYNYSIN